VRHADPAAKALFSVPNAFDNAVDPLQEANAMSRTISMRFQSPLQARNAADDLVATGFPRENVQLDQGARELTVIAAEVIANEVQEILERHRRD